VQAARKLLNATVLQTAAAEQARLSELRRYLAEIKRLRDRLTVRDKVSVCNLFVDAFTNTYPAAGEEKARMEEVWADLLGSGRYDCLLPLDEWATLDPIEAAWSNVRAQWNDGRPLASFVTSGFKSSKEDVARSTAQYVGALGILLFYEREMYENAVQDLAREKHRHSIRLSALNVGQRAQIVHQLAQGLSIYYEGGVKPEEIAQLMLLASQVGGIFYIGSQL
jgi:hypothetical protein